MECPSCHAEVEPNQTICPSCSAALPPDPLIGKVIGGKYRVLQLLGEGGMGAVYKGEQQLGTKTRIVAIKTLHPQYSTDPKIQARFQREVGTVAELEHPNTIQVYDFGTTDEGQLYIVMEFVKGKNLADILEKEGSFEPTRAEHILGQIVGSLEEAHNHGIVHRDLKPDNVVLTERAGQKEFVKVLDFGIAKRSDEDSKSEAKLTQAGMVLGTPPYMSPEQFTGKPIDARSDIYSLAVMAYEMLTGRLPFKAESAFEWATQHMTAPPVPIEEASPSGVRAPAAMRQAIKKGMAKNPADRFSTVREFFEAFSGKGVPDMPLSMLAPNVGGAPRAATAVMSPAGDGGVAPPPVVIGGSGTQRQTLPGDADLGMMGAGGGPGGTMVLGGPQPAGYNPQTTPSAGAMGPPAQAASPYGAPPNAGYGPPPGVQPFVPPPPRQDARSGGGSGRIILLLVALLVGIGSVTAIVIGLRGRSGGGGGLDLGGGTTTTTSDTSSAGGSSTDTPQPADTGLHPLDNGGNEPSSTGKKPKPPPPSTTTTPPPPVTTTTPPPPVTTTTPPPPVTTTEPPPQPPPQPPPPKPQPAACAAAAQMRALGRMAEFQRLAAQCRAQGGTI